MTPPYTTQLELCMRRISCTLMLFSIFGVNKAVAEFSCPQDSIPVKHAVAAAKFCQEKNFDAARKEIDLAMQVDTEKDEVYTWYIRGFIFKEIYKTSESHDRNSASREEATSSFLYSKKLVREQGSEYNNDAALKFLASTYYNDALISASDFDIKDEMQGENQLQKFVDISRKIDPASRTETSEREYYKVRGQRYLTLWSADTCNRALSEKALASYGNALLKGEPDCDMIYNMAIIHYNIYVHASYEGSCYTQEEGTLHVNDALQRLTEAERICPEKIEVISALQNLYRATGDLERANQYGNKLNTLIGRTPGTEKQ